MFNSFRALGQKLSTQPLWVIAAIVLAIGLVGYYGLLGAQYWQASEQIPAHEVEIKNLNRLVRLSSNGDGNLGGQLESEEETLELLSNTFQYPESDDLINIMSQLAHENSIALLVVDANAGDEIVDGDIAFRSHSFNLTVQGEPKDLFKFIAALHKQVPIMTVTSLKMADIEENPSAQIGLRALVDPKIASEEEEGG